ncbi:MAG: hypothetical protein IJU37_11975 [Desulfovibrio sp.]|nr:hypothetical protein [Desulfovibrio sp.]
MSRPLVILASCLVAAVLAGCADVNLRNPFTSDPLTGGQNVGTSRLLSLTIPAGMQLYPTHGSSTTDGGMEVYRGRVEMTSVALYMHSGLAGQGWNLRLTRRQGSRAVSVYERANSVVVLTLERTTLGTLLCIWTGERMPDGAGLPQNVWTAQTGSVGSETYQDFTAPQPQSTESWGGGSDLQEHNL